VQCDDLVEIQSQAFETKEFVRWTGVEVGKTHFTKSLRLGLQLRKEVQQRIR